MVEYMNEKIEILKAAKKLYDHPNRDKLNLGMCTNIRQGLTQYISTYTINKILYPIFKTWPKFSGKEGYPVPHPNWKDPVYAYYRSADKHFWNTEHPYGANRIDLLEHIIKELAKELRNETVGH